MIAYFHKLTVTEAHEQLGMSRAAFYRCRQVENPKIACPPNLNQNSTANARFYAGHLRDYQRALMSGIEPMYKMPTAVQITKIVDHTNRLAQNG